MATMLDLNSILNKQAFSRVPFQTLSGESRDGCKSKCYRKCWRGLKNGSPLHIVVVLSIAGWLECTASSPDVP